MGRTRWAGVIAAAALAGVCVPSPAVACSLLVVCSSPAPAPTATPPPQSAPPVSTPPARPATSPHTERAGPRAQSRVASYQPVTGALRQNVISGIRTNERIFALTLDDGWHPDPRILELIAAWHLHGTAFLVGQVAEANPVFVHRLVALGWEVCSHTYDHKLLTNLSASAVEREIARGRQLVDAAAGTHCPYFRPPGGAVDATVVRVATHLGLKVILWNTSLSDITRPGEDPRIQVAIAMRYLRPGSILLGHWGAVNSYVVLKSVLTAAFAKGYSVGDVTTLLAHGHGQTTSDIPAAVAATPKSPPKHSTLSDAIAARLERTAAWARALWRTHGRLEEAIRLGGFALAWIVVFDWLAARRRQPAFGQDG